MMPLVVRSELYLSLTSARKLANRPLSLAFRTSPYVAVFVTVFSTLGAVIDTALSVTSSVYEVWTHKNSLTAKELTSSGYQVGKEIIGTTVNTLLFAYLGGSILLFAYVQTQQYNLEIILNSKFLFQDVAIMLSGAIACLFTVPVSIRCVIRQIHHAASETDHS